MISFLKNKRTTLSQTTKNLTRYFENGITANLRSWSKMVKKGHNKNIGNVWVKYRAELPRKTGSPKRYKQIFPSIYAMFPYILCCEFYSISNWALNNWLLTFSFWLCYLVINCFFFPWPDSELLQYEEKRSWKGFLLVAHEPGTTVGGSHIRGSMVRASEAGYEEVDLVLPGTGRYIFFSFAKNIWWSSFTLDAAMQY